MRLDEIQPSLVSPIHLHHVDRLHNLLVQLIRLGPHGSSLELLEQPIQVEFLEGLFELGVYRIPDRSLLLCLLLHLLIHLLGEFFPLLPHLSLILPKTPIHLQTP